MRIPTTTPRFLDRAVAYYGDLVGVVADDGTEYTYGEFAARVNRLSNALLDRGLERGDRVAVVSPNTHWCLEAMFAVQQLGMVFVPLNYRLIPGDYEYLLTDAGASLVIADHAFADTLEPVRDGVPTDQFVCYGADRVDGEWVDYETLLAGSDGTRPERPDIEESDPAAINYTSGTTGDPKGVVRTHRNDAWNGVLHALNLGMQDDAVYLWTLPMFHVHGWGAMYTVTAVGGTHVCLREFDAGTVFERIRRHGVSNLSGAPTVLNRLLAHYEDHDVETTGGSGVTVATAGAAPPEATVEAVEDELGWELYHFYGHTETGPIVTSHSPRRVEREGRVSVKTRQGIPSVDFEMRVVDEDGEDVPRDDETLGEVVLRGNTVFDRYWGLPDETEDAFDDRVEGWFHTGDLGTVDGNGSVSIKDRKESVIVSGGENISSIEIEDVIHDMPGVYQVAVIPVPHETWGETPKALVVPRPGAELSEEEVVAYCKEHLASYKAPTTAEFVDDLPETATGKIRKHELREQHWQDHERMIGGG